MCEQRFVSNINTTSLRNMCVKFTFMSKGVCTYCNFDITSKAICEMGFYFRDS